jgi:RHS repeat-associated protein
MPVSVVYTNVAGRVVHEIRGGAERFYGRDPLGSTAALYDEAGNKTDEWEYRPYGEVRSHTGSSPTPLTFVGTLGYFMDAATRYYVRARVYLASLGRWTTVDPLWPQESPYGYVGGMPNGRVDPSGRLPICIVPCAPCAACLIDLLIVCPPGEGFAECVRDVWCELPPWTKALCGLACAGCIGCVSRKRLKPPVWNCAAAIAKAISMLPPPKSPLCLRQCAFQCTTFAEPFGGECSKACMVAAIGYCLGRQVGEA